MLQKSYRQEVFSLGCDKTTINEKSRPVAKNNYERPQKKDVDPHSPIAGFRGPTTETGKSTPQETWNRPSSVEIKLGIRYSDGICLTKIV